MRTALLAFVLLPAAAAGAPPPTPPSPPADPSAVQGDAIRALAQVSAGEPAVEVLQRAAAREVDRSDGARGFRVRARLAALLPKLTAEYRRDQTSNRVVGLQGSGEVDYLRLAPSDTFLLRATWELPSLVADPSELGAATQAQALARRRAEAVEHVTRLYYERRKLRVALVLAPPADPAARAQAELEVERLGAEIDALTGAALRERAP